MKKNLLILMLLMLWAVPRPAPAAETQTPERMEAFEAKTTLGYWSVTNSGSSRAAAYEYLESSVAGGLDVEWDPLPHRFLLESFALNGKDYLGELGYAYRDVVVFNFYTRGLYHNLTHVSLGKDDPLTASPSFVDRNPGEDYASENKLRRAFLRLKLPDFPLHFYVDAQTVDRNATIQQRFLLDTGSVNKVSQSRDINWNTREVTMGLNSHLGFFEADLSHTEKTFSSLVDKTLFDIPSGYSVSVPHNLTPDLKTSTDTIKIHTANSGRIVAAGTYASGDKKNEDSGAKAEFKNMAGDVSFTPIHYLSFFLKYRHYDIQTDNPATTTAPNSFGTMDIYNVRDSLSSKRDLVSGMVKYRLTPRLIFKAEYSIDTTKRDKDFGPDIIVISGMTGTEQNSWDVAHSTTKTTTKVGFTYRVTNKMSLRTDYSVMQVVNPAYASDPDNVDTLKASATWMPFTWLSTLVSYGGIREERDNMSAPLAGGKRTTDRDQALGSLTFLVGKRSSVTASYALYKNTNKETLTYQGMPAFLLTEDGVLMATRSQVASLAATHALSDNMHLSAEASRCRSDDKFRNKYSGSSTQSANDVLVDANIVEDVFAAGLDMQFTKTLGSELRYQYRKYDDKSDDTQDGRVKTMLGTLSLKW